DNATPSGTSAATDALLRLALMTGDDRYQRAATGVLESLGAVASEHATSFGRLLCALDFAVGSPREIAIVGPAADPATQALRQVAFGRFLPNRVVAGADDPDSAPVIPLLEQRPLRDGRPTAYVCEGYV